MIKKTCFIFLIYTLAISIVSVEAQDQDTKLLPVGEEAYQVLLQFFQYDKGVPLDVRIVDKTETANCIREKIVFTGTRNSRVPGYLAFPKNGKPPYPCVLLLHGYTLSKSAWWEDIQDAHGNEWKYAKIANSILSEGYAVLALDAPYHGERRSSNDYEPPGNIFFVNKWGYKLIDSAAQSTIEYMRALDYIVTRADIDSTRIGIFGHSMGGVMTFMVTAIDPRVKVSVASAAPTTKNRYLYYSTSNFAPHITGPFLMLMGRKDDWYTVDNAEQVYNLIKSRIKNIIWYDSGHNLPIKHVKDVVNWFKEHL